MDSEASPSRDLRLSGTGTLEGDLDGLDLKGAMHARVESEHFSDPLIGEATFKQHSIAAKLYNPSKTVSLSTQIHADPKKKSNIAISVLEFSPADYDPDFRCARFSLSSDYNFFIDKFTQGEGNITLDKIALGCAPYRVENKAVSVMPIKDGVLAIRDIQFSSDKTDFRVHGTVSLNDTIEVTANGSLYLQSLLPFVPDVDDLKGTVETTLSVHGTLSDPILDGSAKLRDAEFISERLGIDAHSINLNMALNKDHITVEEFTGQVNDGTCTVQATLTPNALEHSEIGLSCANVSFNPLEETFVVMDGELALRTGELGQPEISGTIFVTHAELQKELSLSTLVESVADYLFKSHTTMLREKEKLPEIDLNIDVEASRNVFVLTNLLESELRANIYIRGNLDQPRVRGKMDVLSGWFGFRDKRFDISSGELRFSPNNPEPRLDILGERLLYLPTGENVFVVLEASGPVSNPSVQLSSDSQLTEQQLLTLLTTGASSPYEAPQTRIKRQEAALALLSDDNDSELMQLLSHLTSIDSIFVEPRLDKRTGLIEPTLVAEKELLSNILLQGSSFITSTTPSSQLGLIYNLTSKSRLIGLIDSDASQDQTSLEANIAYTFWPYQPQFLDIIIDGNKKIAAKDILNKLRMNPLTRLPLTDIDRVGSDIESYYKDQGYLRAQVFVNCHRGAVFCRDLSIRILEGPPTIVSDIEYMGDALP
ncbi:MAG: translocation/assembly module TamB domain-containing protein, partial [Bdellovibrionales bacterium]|nr:translocation/assembly module TamB domain-containing protein [Bdellovibrionales bacterium]